MDLKRDRKNNGGSKRNVLQNQYQIGQLASSLNGKQFTQNPQINTTLRLENPVTKSAAGKKTENYKVWTYQIPVPLGDCSIHVLTYDNLVEHAFIMDGGTKADDEDPVKQIRKAWASVRKDMTSLSPLNDNMKLDSWVVTHWDADHWEGTYHLAKQEFEDTSTVDPKKSNLFIDNPPVLSGAKCDANLDGVRVAKTGDDDDDDDDSDDDDDDDNTVIKTTKGAKGAIGVKGRRVKKEKKVFDGQPTLSKWFEVNDELIGKGLIGRDLFTWEKASMVNNKLIWSDSVRPRFICLGAAGFHITSGEPKEYKAAPSRNETSILSLLYWPSVGVDGRASYWTGGDGFPQITLVLLEKFFKPLKLLPIQVIKLDHHGSSREFSGLTGNKMTQRFMNTEFSNMTTAANPKSIIVTPGDTYGHPCWDVVLFLYAWAVKRMSSAASTQTRNGIHLPRCANLVYTTRVPYWMSDQMILDSGDANTTASRIQLADKLIQMMSGQNSSVTMLELYQYMCIKPPKHDSVSVDSNKKEIPEYSFKEQQLEVDEIDRETLDNMKEVGREWWNWLSAQYSNETGLFQTNPYCLLKMVSVADLAHDGTILICDADGNQRDLTRPSNRGHGYGTRSKKLQTFKEIETDNLPSDPEKEIDPKIYTVNTQSYDSETPVTPNYVSGGMAGVYKDMEKHGVQGYRSGMGSGKPFQRFYREYEKKMAEDAARVSKSPRGLQKKVADKERRRFLIFGHDNNDDANESSSSGSEEYLEDGIFETESEEEIVAKKGRKKKDISSEKKSKRTRKTGLDVVDDKRKKKESVTKDKKSGKKKVKKDENDTKRLFGK